MKVLQTLMGVSIIQTSEQPFELLGFDVNDLLIARGPVKTMLLKSLEPKGIMPHFELCRMQFP
jgi:hypothetical protein